MRVVLPLVIFSIIVLASPILYAEAYSSSSHPYILQWGESGLSSPGKFSFPQNVAVDELGNVYVTDLGNMRIQKFNNEGSFLNAWGSSGSGHGQFQSPAGIAVFNGSVYVVDTQLHRVQQFDLTGNFISTWGEQGDAQGQFLLPNGIAVGTNGTVYVVDTGNQRIQKFNSDGEFISEFGESGYDDGQFVSPFGIAVDVDENIYVSDPSNNIILKFNSEGDFIESFGPNFGGFPIMPQGMVIEPTGNIYVADTGHDRILRISQTGTTLNTWGSMGIENGQFKMPKDISIDNNGNLFVVDTNGHRIQKFSSPYATQLSYQSTIEEQSTTSQPSSAESTTLSSNDLPPVNAIPGDLTKPVIIPPNNLLIEATGGLTPISIGQAMVTDESGIQSLTNNAPENFPLGVTTLIWTAIDGAGNMAIATQIVTVVDTIPPTIGALEDVYVEASTSYSNPVSLPIPTPSDAVGTISITNDAPEFFSLGETIVNWTATDVGGNTAIQQQKVIVGDTTKPRIFPPSDIVFEATSAENEIILGDATALDNGVVISITNDAPQFFAIGNTTVTWIAGDSAGNTVSEQQLVSVIDTTAPKIVPINDFEIEAVSLTENVIDLIIPNVTDSQDVIITNDAPDFFSIGETVVTWSAQDPSGNVSSEPQKIQIIDTTIPILTVPDDVIQESSSANGTAVVLGEPQSDDISGISNTINNAPELFPLGQSIVTWTTSDNYGNSFSANQTITIIDTAPPLITAPADIVIEAVNLDANLIDLGIPHASDINSINSISNDSPEAYPIGITTVTWMAIDSSGNEAYDSQVITIQDTTLPEIFVPENITVEATDAVENIVNFGEAVAVDIIDISSIENDAPSVFSLGETVITWTAIDLVGNTISSQQTITVVDTIPPTITIPPAVIFEAQNITSNVISIGTATGDDAVGIASVTNDAPIMFPIGETIVEWIAIDLVGNTISSQQTITVVDTIPPTITAPEDVIYEAISTTDNTIPLGDAITDDVVGIDSISNDAPAMFPIGETIIEWTVTDHSGNNSTDSQKITLVDTILPIITAPADIIFEATSTTDNAIPLGNALVDDMVGIASVTNNAPAVFPMGETIVEWETSDLSGNFAADLQTITVVDTIPPIIIIPEDVIYEAISTTDNTIPLGDAITDDVVGIDSLTNNAPAVFPIGETIVEWTASDLVGNTISSQQTVTVVDTIPPTIAAPEDIIFEATSTSDNVVLLGDAVADDVVGIESVTNNAPAVFPIGETIVEWTASDLVGNTISSQQTVTVVDTVLPTISAPEDIIYEATSTSDNAVPLGEAIANDIVGIDSVTNNAPAVFPIGETIVEWTVTDHAGNNKTDSQKITIKDTTAPSLIIPEDIVVNAISQNTPAFIGNAQVTDFTDSEPTVENDATFSFTLGQTFVTWTATDQYGNSVEAVQVITVQACGKPESYYNLIIGTPQDDYLTGTDGADLIFADGGDDIISAQKGNDCIFAEDGDDIIFGNEGGDNISGGDGNDIIKGQSGDDTISGSFGIDIIDGGDDNDSCNTNEVPDDDLVIKCES